MPDLRAGVPGLVHRAGQPRRAGQRAGWPRRPRSVSVLDRFAIDYALCMYCGICVDVCPFDALHWVGALRSSRPVPEGTSSWGPTRLAGLAAPTAPGRTGRGMSAAGRVGDRSEAVV
ncbi:MAG: 4Fe-4S binding protein [Candidatus Nanopelagicales bacterium]